MEYGKTIESDGIKEKLRKLEKESGARNTCVAWIKFPYSKNNLKVIEESLRELNWNREEYRLSYDENFIIVDKELL